MTRRSIAITKRGYIAAIAQEALLGDFVCALFGCSVPVVLRKRIGEEYKFVGECYISMDLWMGRHSQCAPVGKWKRMISF